MLSNGWTSYQVFRTACVNSWTGYPNDYTACENYRTGNANNCTACENFRTGWHRWMNVFTINFMRSNCRKSRTDRLSFRTNGQSRGCPGVPVHEGIPFVFITIHGVMTHSLLFPSFVYRYTRTQPQRGSDSRLSRIERIVNCSDVIKYWLPTAVRKLPDEVFKFVKQKLSSASSIN